MTRLVYLGTPDAAVPPLRALVEAGHDVALVVSRPDKRRGRGSGLVPSPVKAAAVELGLEVTDSLDPVASVGAELGVVVAYGRIIPVSVLDLLPMVNLHFSLLPRWRGAAPVERAILEGDAETGVCLMAVEAGLDTGGVYAEATVPIGEEETAEQLRDRLVAVGCDLLVQHLGDGLAGLPVPRDQVGTPSYAEKVLAAEHELHWDQDSARIRRVIRLGRAWTTFRSRRVAILEATGADAAEVGTEGLVPGTLVGDCVATGGGGPVRLVTVKPEGKRPMEARDWLRGVRPESSEQLGA
jgi:methionyl-tRNA formyltransferase